MRKKKTVNKKVRNATAMKYDGVQFKSKLEVHCYKKLKEANIDFQYENIKYDLIQPFVFDNDSWELYKRKGERVFGLQNNKIRGITYTPDFVGMYPNSKLKMFIIETKGNPNDAFPLRWKLFKRHLQLTKQDTDLYMPRNQKQTEEVVQLILKKYEHKS